MNTMNKTKTVSPYFAFILLHSLQVGIGILGYQRVILKNAGYDAWISLIIAGIATHIVLFCMLKMLEKDGDLISIHTTTFGKWVGSIFSVIFTLYCIKKTLHHKHSSFREKVRHKDPLHPLLHTFPLIV